MVYWLGLCSQVETVWPMFAAGGDDDRSVSIEADRAGMCDLSPWKTARANS